jgi:hypothetical protein
MKQIVMKESTPKGGEPKPSRIQKHYGIRDVIKQNYRSLIKKEIPCDTADSAYIGHYQKAVTAVHQNMMDEQLKEAQRIADLWNRKELL